MISRAEESRTSESDELSDDVHYCEEDEDESSEETICS